MPLPVAVQQAPIGFVPRSNCDAGMYVKAFVGLQKPSLKREPPLSHVNAKSGGRSQVLFDRQASRHILPEPFTSSQWRERHWLSVSQQ